MIFFHRDCRSFKNCRYMAHGAVAYRRFPIGTGCWRACPHAHICHVIHPKEDTSWSTLIFSRRTFSLYHQVAVGRGKFGDRRIYSNYKRTGKALCRFGCSVVETVHHIFLECPGCNTDTDDLRMICRRKRYDYDLRNLFTQQYLQPKVEIFWGNIFPKDASSFFFFLIFLLFVLFRSFCCLSLLFCFCFSPGLGLPFLPL